MSISKTRKATRSADFAFASLLSGAYGSAAIALFFLVVDSLRGSPFLTPSMMGSAVFLGTEPSAATSMRMDVMAAYTLVHFVVFVALGTAITWLRTRVDLLARNGLSLATAVLAALTLGSIAVDQLLLPGLLMAIGALPLVAAHTLAALVMGFFIHHTLEEAVAEKAAVSAQAEPAEIRITS